MIRAAIESHMANLRAQPGLRTVTIALVRDHKDARRIQDKLRFAGIESFLATEPSYSLNKPANRERRAVKIQVGRADVQRALGILGAANLGPRSEAAGGGRNLRWLAGENPIVPVIVVISILVAAAILFLT
jgi:hypothetical protein